MRSGIHRFLHEIQAAKARMMRVPRWGSLDITWECRQAAERAGYPMLFISPFRADPSNLVYADYWLTTILPEPASWNADGVDAFFVNSQSVLREFVNQAGWVNLWVDRRILGVDLYLRYSVIAMKITIVPAMKITFHET